MVYEVREPFSTSPSAFIKHRTKKKEQTPISANIHHTYREKPTVKKSRAQIQFFPKLWTNARHVQRFYVGEVFKPEKFFLLSGVVFIYTCRFIATKFFSQRGSLFYTCLHSLATWERALGCRTKI